MSQKELILAHLLKGKSITAREAIAYFNIIRLSAIIWTLKKEGYQFITKHKMNYNGVGQYAKYKLVNKKVKYDF